MQYYNQTPINYNPSSHQQLQQLIITIDKDNQQSKVLQNNQNNHSLIINNDHSPQPQQMQHNNHNCTTHNNKRSPSYQQIQYDNKSYHNYINQVNIEPSPQHIDLQQLIIQPNPNLNNHLSELKETTRRKSPRLQLSQDTSSSVSSQQPQSQKQDNNNLKKRKKNNTQTQRSTKQKYTPLNVTCIGTPRVSSSARITNFYSHLPSISPPTINIVISSQDPDPPNRTPTTRVHQDSSVEHQTFYSSLPTLVPSTQSGPSARCSPGNPGGPTGQG